MNRSGVAKVRTSKNKNRGKYNPKSNPIIAKHWDKDLTPAQNYKKLGLTFRLSAQSGGEEKKIKIKPIQHNNMEENLYESDDDDDHNNDENNDDNLDPYDPANILEGTAKMRRDENGNIIEIIYGTKKIIEKDNLQDIDGKDSDDENSEAKQVIAELEELSKLPKKKDIHWLSELDVFRCEKLLAKYGDDYEKMKWDKKLNPFQLSPGQLRKLIAKHLEQIELRKIKQNRQSGNNDDDDDDDEEEEEDK